MLTPQLKHLNGYVASNYQFESDNFQVVVDLEIFNKEREAIAFGEFYIYFLSHMPDATKEAFGDGLADMGVFKGLKIRINENIFRTTRNGVKERSHLIHGRFNAKDGTSYESKCTLGFNRGKLRLASNKE